MRALPRGTGVALIRFRGTVNKTILLVDDDLHSREGLRQSLVGGGFMVATAQDGAQAIKQMIESEVGMAIIDLDLPPVKGVTISGWDVVRICRAFDAATLHPSGRRCTQDRVQRRGGGRGHPGAAVTDRGTARGLGPAGVDTPPRRNTARQVRKLEARDVDSDPAR